MIQRVQYMYFLLVIAICIAMFFVPIYTAQFHCKGAEIIQIVTLISNRAEYSLGLEEGLGALKRLPVIYGTINIVILALCTTAIGMYRNRKRQLVFSRYLLALSIIYLGLMYYTIYFGTFDPFCPAKGHLEAGAFLPLMPPILLLLAGMAISKDIEKVKSADRLR